MLQNKPSVTGPVAKFGFDAAENELSEVEISTIFWRSFWWSRDEKKVSPKIGDFWRRTLSPLSWRGSVIFLRRMTFSQSSTEKARGLRLGRSSRRSWSHTSRCLREFGWVRCPLALNLVFSSSSWQAYSKPNHRSGIVFMHRAAWSFRRLPRATTSHWKHGDPLDHTYSVWSSFLERNLAVSLSSLSMEYVWTHWFKVNTSGIHIHTMYTSA